MVILETFYQKNQREEVKIRDRIKNLRLKEFFLKEKVVSQKDSLKAELRYQIYSRLFFQVLLYSIFCTEKAEIPISDFLSKNSGFFSKEKKILKEYIEHFIKELDLGFNFRVSIEEEHHNFGSSFYICYLPLYDDYYKFKKFIKRLVNKN